MVQSGNVHCQVQTNQRHFAMNDQVACVRSLVPWGWLSDNPCRLNNLRRNLLSESSYWAEKWSPLPNFFYFSCVLCGFASTCLFWALRNDYSFSFENFSINHRKLIPVVPEGFPDGKQLLLSSGHPFLMTAINPSMSGSVVVLACRSDIFWSETRRFATARRTWASEALCVSSVSLSYRGENVSATGISFSGLWRTLKSYF